LVLSLEWKNEGSGSTNGWPDVVCAPSVNPCAPAVPWQASRRHFILLCSTSFSCFVRRLETTTQWSVQVNKDLMFHQATRHTQTGYTKRWIAWIVWIVGSVQKPKRRQKTAKYGE